METAVKYTYLMWVLHTDICKHFILIGVGLEVALDPVFKKIPFFFDALACLDFQYATLFEFQEISVLHFSYAFSLICIGCSLGGDQVSPTNMNVLFFK